MSKTEALGVDFGGVIMLLNRSGEGSEFTPNSLPNAFESLQRLAEKRFGDKIFIVSKAQPETQEKVLAWLLEKHFYEFTGINPRNVNFCIERNEKAAICQRLGITHFIDDRLENLGHISEIGVKNLYLFQGQDDEVKDNGKFLPLVHRVDSWQEILDELLPKD